MTSDLTHIDSSGNVRMVDIGDKQVTERMALATGEIIMKEETLRLIATGDLKKGDLIAAAKIAGILAAKKTSNLIPLCHPLPINHILVDIEPNYDLPGFDITVAVRTIGKTGVEMEALTAVSVAALTVFDMVKAVEKTMKINNIRLVEKRGGKSGVIINE